MICNLKEHRIIQVWCQDEALCPTPAAHARINEAHRLWHQAADSYDDPDGFRVNLNACIQALRSVTFVLQKEKSRIPDFDIWYKGWQNRLKADPILKWLVEARNLIVKEGDLETRSRVRAAIFYNYIESPAFEINVPPLMSTNDIAGQMASQDISEELIKNGLLRVKRKWISIDLPDHELLETLAHSYGVLSTLISDAHTQAGVAYPKVYMKHKDGTIESYHESIDHLQGRLPCMEALSESVTVWVKLSTGEYLKSNLAREIPKISEKEITDTYGPFLKSEQKSPNRREWAKLLLENDKRVLSVDGYHVPIMFLELPDGKTNMMTFKAEDPSEKYIVAQKLANEVKRTGTKSIISIGETWQAPYDKRYLGKPIEELLNRDEALTVDCISSDGEEFSFTCKFRRENDSIQFDAVEELTGPSNIFFTPVRQAWRRQKWEPIRKKFLHKYKIGRNDSCPCQSGKKFKKCCAPHIGTNFMEMANDLYDQNRYEEAEEAYRAWLTQYIIWYNEHTVPFVKDKPKDADELLVVDIEAITSILYSIRNCLYHQGKEDEIGPFLKKASDIIDDHRFRSNIGSLRAGLEKSWPQKSPPKST